MTIKAELRTQTTDFKITFNSTEKGSIDRKVTKKIDLPSEQAASTASRTESAVAPVLTAVSDLPLVLPLYPSMTHYESTFDPKNSDWNVRGFIKDIKKGKFKTKPIHTIAGKSIHRDLRTIENHFPEIAKKFDSLKRGDSPSSKFLRTDLGAKIEINIEEAHKTITVERENRKRKFGIHEDPNGKKPPAFYPIEGFGMIQVCGSELKNLVEKFQASGHTSFVQFALKMKKESKSPDQNEKEIPPAKEKPAFSLQVREERQKARYASSNSYASRSPKAQGPNRGAR